MATNKVDPRPKSTAFTGAYERKVWDEKYKATHNPDGTPKAGAVVPKNEAPAKAMEKPASKNKVPARPTSTAFTGGYERKVWDEKYKSSYNPDGTPKGATAKGRRGGIVDSSLPPSTKDKTPAVAPAAPKAAEPKAKQMLAGREVKNGKVFVSAKELADFKKKYGTDKTLTDLLNKERNLTRREDKSKLKPLKTLEEDKKALADKRAKERAKDEARKKEVAEMVKRANLSKGGMAKKGK